MNTKIFYDGVSLEQFANTPSVVGFTTNTGFMNQAGIKDYKKFADRALELADGRPISFQAFATDTQELIHQAKTISSWGSNVWVKIPVVSEEGESHISVISSLLKEGVQVNVTTVFTKEQINSLANSIEEGQKAIVSVFAGRISDAGHDPEEYIRHAVKAFKYNPSVEILWAGCQCVYDVVRSDKCGCHIITVPDSPLKKLNRLSKDLFDFSVETSRGFGEDARSACLTV